MTAPDGEATFRGPEPAPTNDATPRGDATHGEPARSKATPDEPAPDGKATPDEPAPDGKATTDEPAPDGKAIPDEPAPDGKAIPDEPAPDGKATTDEPKPAPRRLRSAVEWAAVIAGALVIAVLVRTFLVQAFSIPSESMESTLNRGDRLLVDKVSYRFSDVQRGDIVVFDSPGGRLMNTDEPLIKRVIGLEGETVGLSDGVVTIDGNRLPEPYLDLDILTFSLGPMPGCIGGDSPDRCTVAEGHVFVLGDNRSSSRDSRFFGPVEIDAIVGRAWLKYWPPGDIGTL